MKSSKQLLEEGRRIYKEEYVVPDKGFISPDYISGPKFEKWKNDLKIFASQLDDICPLKNDLMNHKLLQNSCAYEMKEVFGILESLSDDDSQFAMQIKSMKEYDVFISHASKDKSDYVDSLYLAIRKLGVNIFYDTEILSWGDNWKQVILDGTEKSEFAIIVISENFFGREWTERELDEFLKRQNTSGQKVVLPLLHNISLDMLKEKYPVLGDIQVIDTERYNKDEVTVLFAKELIKRLK